MCCFLFISCKKENRSLNLEPLFDCEFSEKSNSTDGILDETEREILRNCYSNELTSQAEIEANLIGEWELVGFGDGWFSHPAQPCGYMLIDSDKLTFEFHNEYLDTISIHEWEVENNWLKVTPADKHLSMNLFCNKYMIGSYSDFGVHTIDVDRYIYEKVK